MSTSYLAASTAAGTWNAPERQLAEKIIYVTGQEAISVQVENRSTLKQADAVQIKRALLSELAALGAHITNPDQAAAAVEIVLSEQLQNHVWVGEIRQGTRGPTVVLVSIPDSEVAASLQNSAALVLHKLLLWSQPGEILDAALVNSNPQRAIVLDANGISILRFQNTRWQQEQSLPVGHDKPWPRDLRGRIVLRNDHLFDAYLPGVFCQSTASSPFGLNCTQGNVPWPLSPSGTNGSAFSSPGLSAIFNDEQNSFTGTLHQGADAQKSVPAFFSGALLPLVNYPLWIFSGVDGRLYMLDNSSVLKTIPLDLGSDVASVHSGCGTSWQLLATSAGQPHVEWQNKTVTQGANENSREDEGDLRDSVQAFAITDQELIPVSQVLNFSGAIRALWAHSDGNSVTAVMRNSTARTYEAYQLTIDCGQ